MSRLDRWTLILGMRLGECYDSWLTCTLLTCTRRKLLRARHEMRAPYAMPQEWPITDIVGCVTCLKPHPHWTAKVNDRQGTRLRLVSRPEGLGQTCLDVTWLDVKGQIRCDRQLWLVNSGELQFKTCCDWMINVRCGWYSSLLFRHFDCRRIVFRS